MKALLLSCILLLCVNNVFADGIVRYGVREEEAKCVKELYKIANQDGRTIAVLPHFISGLLMNNPPCVVVALLKEMKSD